MEVSSFGAAERLDLPHVGDSPEDQSRFSMLLAPNTPFLEASTSFSPTRALPQAHLRRKDAAEIRRSRECGDGAEVGS